MIKAEQVKNDPAIRTYIQKADDCLGALGYTEHSFAHVGRVAAEAKRILLLLGKEPRQAELAEIAGYLHDIGNIVNREEHAQSGAIMAFRLLDKMGMDAAESAEVICAIGNHDEGTAEPVSDIAAALILADKSDVRRSRVRNPSMDAFDIHDRVNWSVRKSELALEPAAGIITLHLDIDTEICSVMEYFEIFIGRMALCRRAAQRLDLCFHIVINDQKIL